jgi:[acyl-carrier-protein] S-malonyltransferase
MFPGQGSQFAGMADPWLRHPVSSAVFDVASAQLGFDLAEACRDSDALARTDTVQLGVFVCDVAAFRVLEWAGVRPVAVAGHSLGEFAALVAAGVLEFPAALEAVRQRAEAMVAASAATPGAMTALMGLSSAEAADVCAVAGRGDVLTVANENSPKQTVLSGTVAAIERAEALARTRGARPIRLRVAGAFHSPLMTPALAGLRSALARLEFRPPICSVVPNVSGRPTVQPAAIRDLLSRHLLSPVRWERSMTSIAGLGVTRLIEAGPGDTLSKLAKRCVPGMDVVTAGTPEEALAVAGEPAPVGA